MKIICENCGEIEHGLYDGYGVAERLLEGVKFEVRIKKSKFKEEIVAKVQDQDKEYFKSNGISMSKWEKEVADCVKDEEVTCPHCKDDAYIVEE
jgi:hypothetical protein